VGIVVKNGILLLDQAQHAEQNGIALEEAVVQAGRVRLRPILMTTLTAILGLAFILLQVIGYMSFEARGIKLVGRGSNASNSFILAIGGLHALHVLVAGGVVALLVVHAVPALRKLPASYREYQALRQHLRGMRHLDSTLWYWQVVTGLVTGAVGVDPAVADAARELFPAS